MEYTKFASKIQDCAYSHLWSHLSKRKIRDDVSTVSSPMAAVVAQRGIKDAKKLIDRKEI